MNAQFKTKLIQYLSNKKKVQGFTLIELLVVVIIVGILAAVALPNLLGQVGKARETEGKNGVGTLNRSQQAYHFERQNFPDTALDDAQLAANNFLGVVVASDYYDFATAIGTATTVIQSASASDPANDGVRSYSGGVGFEAGLYENVVCQSDSIGATVPTVAATSTPTCTTGQALE